MKRWKKILFGGVVSAMLVVAVLFVMIYRSMLPTTGSRIGPYVSPRTALLVIDVQEDYTGPDARKRYRDGNRIVEASNALLAQAQKKGILMVFIKNVIDNPMISVLTGGINAPGAPGTEMDRRLFRVPGAKTFSKNRSDAFSNPELDAFLRGNNVDRLLLTGLDAAYCVNATALGALNRGYTVILFPDGIATESGKNLKELSLRWRQAGAQVKDGSEIE
jgi:nicotinamidase-related amidase